MRFTCKTCGEEHDLAEIAFGAEAPAQWSVLSAAQRADSLLNDELCVVETEEGTTYHVRACLEVPIRESDEPFVWGVWCSLSHRSFREVRDHWRDPDRAKLGPYAARLSTRLPGYDDTLFLGGDLHQREVGESPRVELAESDHQLAVDQRDGIEPDRIRGIVHDLLHP